MLKNRELVAIDCRQVWQAMVDYLEGDLTPEMRTRIDNHLKDCRHCKAIYDGSRNVVLLLADENVFQLPEGFSQRLYQRLSSATR